MSCFGLTLPFLCLIPQTLERQFVDLSAQHVVREVTTGGAATLPGGPGAPRGGGGGPIRWWHDDGDEQWIPNWVAAADHGAAVVVGKVLNTDRVSVYTGTSPVPYFDLRSKRFEFTLPVAGAEFEPVVAALTTVDLDRSRLIDLETTLHVWDSAHGSTPLFEFTFDSDPGAVGISPRGVRVSRDGNLVVAASPNEQKHTLDIVTFDRQGNLLQRVDLPVNIPWAEDLELSDDGTRLLIVVLGESVLYDTLTGQVLFRTPLNDIFHPHALSGDGHRIATAQRIFSGGQIIGSYSLFEEDSTGQWSQILQRDFNRRRFVTDLDLDQDGDRLAYALEHTSFDTYEVRLQDVDQDLELFSHEFSAPGSANQNLVQRLELDDAGRILAGGSWGDDQHLTPEIFVFDDAGNLLVAENRRGSVMDLDLSADGEVLVVGSKGTHANAFGNGGDVTFLDTTAPRLHLAGLPARGASLALDLDEGAVPDAYLLGLSGGLLPPPPGSLRIDFTQLYGWIGPGKVPAGGLSLPLDVPNDPALVGLPAHFQAFFLPLGGGALEYGNRLSLRVVE